MIPYSVSNMIGVVGLNIAYGIGIAVTLFLIVIILKDYIGMFRQWLKKKRKS